MLILVIVLGLLIIFCLYKHPFKKLNQFEINQLEIDHQTIILDLRDYNEAHKTPLPGAYNIPHAYIKRYYTELPKKCIIVATPSQSKRENSAIRFLTKKGFQVVGIVQA